LITDTWARPHIPVGSRRVWLNWEFFEIAVIHPLIPGDLSLQTIREVSSLFADATQPLAFAEWKSRVAVVLHLNDSQIEAL
jgi:hypothetical protein